MITVVDLQNVADRFRATEPERFDALQTISEGIEGRIARWPSTVAQCGRFWGAHTGPNPTDRGKNGSKRHVACDGQGMPLAITHTAANIHDSQAAIPLIDAIPPFKRPGGGRRKRPDAAFADRAYDAEEKIRVPLRERGIKVFIAKRGTDHGSGLGVHRCVVEWTFSWMFQFRRLRVRYEKRADIHTAFLTIGCLLICWNRLKGFC